MRILVVEDDKKTADYIVKGLSEAGYVVDRAETGPDGLHLATSGSYDLVVLDRMLPGLDGLSVVRALRAAGLTVPVLILSALAQLDDRVTGLRAGGDDYLTKPFAFAELSARVEALLWVSAPCRADLNGDGIVDFADYLEFLNLFDAMDPRVDFNGDGLVDFADYLEFLNLYDAGC